MRVERVPVDDARWGEFVSSHPAAGPFHLPAWTTTIADCYGFESFALLVLDSDGEVLAGMPVVEVRTPFRGRKWVSLPFSDSCPLLVRPGTDEADATQSLAEYALSDGTRDLEVRSDLPPAPDRHPVSAGYEHRVVLPADPEDLRVRKNHRNMRNRAYSAGIRVVRGTSADDLATLYRLHTLTRRRLGVPVQPRRLFRLIGERLIARGHGFVATAVLDGEALSSGLYLGYNGTLVAKYHATGPVRSDSGASHLVDWEILSAACLEGYHTLDLGRTDIGADGLRRYKDGWGAVETPLVYTHVSETAPGAGFPTQGDLSRRIVRASPLWVVRALGEVLYRWTA